MVIVVKFLTNGVRFLIAGRGAVLDRLTLIWRPFRIGDIEEFARLFVR